MSKQLQKTLESEFRDLVKELPQNPPSNLKLQKYDIPDDFEQFNKLIGLPKHPATLEPMMLMPYQLRFYKTISETKHHKFHINKARQMGFSELVLRIASYRAFGKYQGKAIKIMAGTRSKTTKKLLVRLKAFFREIPDTVEDWGDDLSLKLKNGTSFEGLPATVEALTGDTKIPCLIMDEAAKWDLIDDSPVIDSIMPIVDTNKTDLFLLSTPKGRRGFFFHYDEGIHAQNDFLKLKYNIWETEGYINTTEEIEKMLADKSVDVEQEYLNQYTTSRSSYYGNVFTEGSHDEQDLSKFG